MFPSVAYLYAAPVEMEDYLTEQLGFWSNFHSLNYEPMMQVYRQLLLEKPVVEHLDPTHLLDEERIVASFDLKTVRVEELETIQAYDLEFCATRDGQLHGFAFWFDVVFVTDADVVTLSTSPAQEQTHWKQTVALLPEALDLFVRDSRLSSSKRNDEEAGGENSLSVKVNDTFQCFVIMNQSEENPRNYQIDIGVDLGKYGNKEEDDEYDDEEEEEEDEEHPTPCECGSMKCMIIKATLEKYENEAKYSS
jgi:hypothetical protein